MFQQRQRKMMAGSALFDRYHKADQRTGARTMQEIVRAAVLFLPISFYPLHEKF